MSVVSVRDARIIRERSAANDLEAEREEHEDHEEIGTATTTSGRRMREDPETR
jgi:hypothetical protein